VTFAAFGLRSLFPGSAFFDSEAIWPYLEQSRADAVEVDIVSGACMLLARSLWNRLGGFDRCYFMYGEDADLCLRACQMGYQPVIVRKAGVVHHVSGSAASSAATQIFLLTARTTLARRHGPPTLRMSIAFLYRLHVLLRLGGSSLFDFATGFRKAARTDWRQVWRNRGIWICGYPAQSVETRSSDGRN
jgi:GT2 family glycosyltransferase